jgi:hypothetical protein
MLSRALSKSDRCAAIPSVSEAACWLPCRDHFRVQRGHFSALRACGTRAASCLRAIRAYSAARAEPRGGSCCRATRSTRSISVRCSRNVGVGRTDRPIRARERWRRSRVLIRMIDPHMVKAFDHALQLADVSGPGGLSARSARRDAPDLGARPLPPVQHGQVALDGSGISSCASRAGIMSVIPELVVESARSTPGATPPGVAVAGAMTRTSTGSTTDPTGRTACPAAPGGLGLQLGPHLRDSPRKRPARGSPHQPDAIGDGAAERPRLWPNSSLDEVVWHAAQLRAMNGPVRRGPA